MLAGAGMIWTMQRDSQRRWDKGQQPCLSISVASGMMLVVIWVPLALPYAQLHCTERTSVVPEMAGHFTQGQLAKNFRVDSIGDTLADVGGLMNENAK